MSVESGKEERKTDIIQRKRAKIETRANFYTLRVAKEWNSLPENLKKQKSVNAFKNKLDKWTKEQKKGRDE